MLRPKCNKVRSFACLEDKFTIFENYQPRTLFLFQTELQLPRQYHNDDKKTHTLS